MFRKPRDNSNGLTTQLGRPPSPSSTASPSKPSPSTLPPSPAATTQPRSVSMATRTTKWPLAGGNATRRVIATPSKSKGKSAGGAGKANQSILSFFKKAEPSPNARSRASDAEEEDLFVRDVNDLAIAKNQEQEEGPGASAEWKEHRFPKQVPTPPKEEDEGEDEEPSRFNEDGGSVKRRKTGLRLFGRSLGMTDAVTEVDAGSSSLVKEEEEEKEANEDPHDSTRVQTPVQDDVVTEKAEITDKNTGATDTLEQSTRHERTVNLETPPSLTRESTIAMFEEFDDEDFVDDETLAELGEEFLERRFAEEQRRLEREAGDLVEQGEGEDQDSDPVFEDQSNEEARESCTLDSDAPPCPICNIALAGITAEQASTHVNNCLDGRPTPLPKPAKQPPGVRDEPKVPAKRFMKAAIARPGQQNPFSLGGEASIAPGGSGGGSAFSKLMSGHAEDTAWATAAANELASRGKPAFKRTCPFYKILPGFNICVDAFRYGAVQGCSAYFLSHFHSDHYIGLTSSWCHGPIYCSKVTANLVKQQLRVNEKYVVALEFDKKVEVPGTNGVFVTMIPANHCPGSSLFLYEKEMHNGPKVKVKRVLHCGDFRACPAHVQHPLLRPDVIDMVSGQKHEQKLDVCYLDTTYLTPKYAFPLQHEVIQACADMCVSLSKEKMDENDDWERMKRERAGAGMVKFIQNDSESGKSGPVKELDEDGKVLYIDKDSSSSNSTAISTTKAKKRGRLLVVVGTYSIGKERICLGIARALNSKIYATSGKQRICAALEDPELSSLLTSDPLEAQVHMQMIMEIRPETLAEYLASYRPHFSRVVGFRPSGWNYRPPNSRFTENPGVQTVLYGDNWQSRYSMADLMPQRGSTREASCFGVPYSEHSSFRELTMFCCALRIDKIIPTVNVGSARSRERMKAWFEKWEQDRRKNGLYKVSDDATSW